MIWLPLIHPSQKEKERGVPTPSDVDSDSSYGEAFCSNMQGKIDAHPELRSYGSDLLGYGGASMSYKRNLYCRAVKRACPICWSKLQIGVREDELHIMFSCVYLSREGRDDLWKPIIENPLCNVNTVNIHPWEDNAVREELFWKIWGLVSCDIEETNVANEYADRMKVEKAIERHALEKRGLDPNTCNIVVPPKRGELVGG